MSTNIDFTQMFHQMHQHVQTQEVQEDESLFVQDTINEHRIHVQDIMKIYGRPLNGIESKMIHTIQAVDDYSWNRDARGGLTTGMPLFDESIDGGVMPGMFLFASSPNVGKSAMLQQMSQNIADLNENVHVAYHSLDDSANELTPRYISCREKITISQAKNPAKYTDKPHILQKRNRALKHLYKNVHKYSMWDSNDGTSVEILEARIQDMKMQYPVGTRIVIVIDSIYDLTVDSKPLQDKALYEYVAKKVKSWVTAYDVVVLCTAHLRKVQAGRRPETSDLKESNRLEFEANFIALLYNEVGIKEENAQVYWIDEEDESKKPVIEMRVGKNKMGSFKGTLFYEFSPNISYMVEAPIEDVRRYAALVYQS